DNEDDVMSEATSGCSRAVSLNGSSRLVATVLMGFFRPFPAAQRLKLLTSMCERWGVEVDGVAGNRNLDGRAAALVDLLAVKLNHVLERAAGVSTWYSHALRSVSDRRSMGWSSSIPPERRPLIASSCASSWMETCRDRFGASTISSPNSSRTVEFGMPNFYGR
ncbi:uncharacterized protein TM35_000661120, partial [Trypanosoma theileri]